VTNTALEKFPFGCDYETIMDITGNYMLIKSFRIKLIA
jgi:hypothetical protein